MDKSLSETPNPASKSPNLNPTESPFSVIPRDIRQETLLQSRLSEYVRRHFDTPYFRNVEGQRQLDRISAELFARVRHHPLAMELTSQTGALAGGWGTGSAPEIRKALAPLFSEALFLAIRKDSTLMWLVTASRLESWLNAHVKELSDGRSVRSEWRQKLWGNALVAKQGGKAILEAFLEQMHDERNPRPASAFFPYLQHCIHNAMLDEVRKKGLRAPQEREIAQIADTREEAVPVFVQAGSAEEEPERRLRKREREDRRVWLLEQVRELARRNPSNPNCKMALDYLTWRAEAPDDEERTQTAFAKQFNHKGGQVNSCLNRFREFFSKSYQGLNLRDFYTTMGDHQ